MNKTLSLVVKLLLITAVAALVLALTNSVTSPIIAERQAQEFVDSYSQAYPDGAEFNTIEENVNENIAEVIEVKDSSGNQIGYVFSGVGIGGYGGNMTYIMGVSNEGVVQGFKALTHSETTGYGAKIDDQEFVDGVTGVNIANGVTYGSGDKDNGEIQAISGATITTAALTNSFYSVAQHMAELSDEIAPIGDVIDPYYASVLKDTYLPLFGADTIKEVESINNDNLSRVYDLFKGEEVVGRVFQIKGQGYGGSIHAILGVDLENTIKDFTVASSNETPNFGAVIEDEIYENSIVGKSLNKTIKLKAEPKRDQDILLISGATVTSMAMQDAMNGAVDGLSDYEALSEKTYIDLDLDTLIAEEAEASGPSVDYLATFEGIDAVEPVEGIEVEGVTAVNTALSGGQEVGRIIDVTVEGFHDISAGILVDANGIVQQVKYYDFTETEGFGDVAAEEAYIAKLVGNDLNSETFSATAEGSAANEVESISGATYTTDGIVKMMDLAGQAYRATK